MDDSTLQVSEDTSWITSVSLNNKVITVNYEANESFSTRNGQVTVTGTDI